MAPSLRGKKALIKLLIGPSQGVNHTSLGVPTSPSDKNIIVSRTRLLMFSHHPFAAVLTRDDLRELYSLLYDACIKWESLGLALGLKYITIKIIERNNPQDVEGCFRVLLSKWLETARRPTLEELAAALEDDLVAMPRLGRAVQERFVRSASSGNQLQEDSERGKLTYIICDGLL